MKTFHFTLSAGLALSALLMQKSTQGKQIERFELRHSRLVLNELAFVKVKGPSGSQVKVEIDGKAVDADLNVDSGRYVLSFANEINLKAGQTMKINFV